MGPAKWCTKKSASSVLLPSFLRHTDAGPQTSKNGEDACALLTLATSFAPSDATKPLEHSESSNLKMPIGRFVNSSIQGVLSGKQVLSQSIPVCATRGFSDGRVDAIDANLKKQTPSPHPRAYIPRPPPQKLDH